MIFAEKFNATIKSSATLNRLLGSKIDPSFISIILVNGFHFKVVVQIMMDGCLREKKVFLAAAMFELNSNHGDQISDQRIQ